MAEPNKLRVLPGLDELPATALLTRVQVSNISNFSVPTLRHWGSCGRGPRVSIVEGRPRYSVRDVREWLSVAAGATR